MSAAPTNDDRLFAGEVHDGFFATLPARATRQLLPRRRSDARTRGELFKQAARRAQLIDARIAYLLDELAALRIERENITKVIG